MGDLAPATLAGDAQEQLAIALGVAVVRVDAVRAWLKFGDPERRGPALAHTTCGEALREDGDGRDRARELDVDVGHRTRVP
jgi:hypothetical protein